MCTVSQRQWECQLCVCLSVFFGRKEGEMEMEMADRYWEHVCMPQRYPLFHPYRPSETRTVRWTILVILFSGSFGSPGILERSGIGAKAVPEGICGKQPVDWPGVVENYQVSSLLRDDCRGPSIFLTF
ncbi:hypothetical protein DFH94DRAFT_788650 [Russula ochroleuca]|uniref:Glucose-methanol-choline oxidoreductase N-terminal domain-containing protein n=1 Tax=Russula ochroleuca TaxID=152965 RepID=A0A9P5JTG3_9AGAM|nr:hypothetical protein DFH94DRAFT_788650 [Russula ochroleuca]